MHKCKVVAVIFVCVLTILTFVSATQITADKSYFPLPADNATIILLNGTSYAANGVYLAAGNYSEGRLYSWYFPMFSTGNGTIDLRVFAQNCNVTITAYNEIQNRTGYADVNVTSWLNYTVTGTGTQSLDYSTGMGGTSTVYIDDTLRQQGDGWNWTDLGLTVTGAAQKVSIHSEVTDYFPPRNAPNAPWTGIYIIVGAVVVIAAITVTLLMLKRHKRQQFPRQNLNA